LCVGVLGVLYGCVLFFGFLFLLLLLDRPQIGIYCAVGAAPFLPTMAMAGLLFITGACFFLQLLFGNRYHFRMNPTGLFLLVFALLLLFYGATSYSIQQSLRVALLMVLFVGSYFLITSLLLKKQAIRNILFVYCSSALMTGAVGLYQFLSGQIDVTWTDTELFENMGRVYSTFDNPNVYGVYLLLVIPVAFAMIFLCQRMVGRVYYAGTCAVLLVNLGLTYSRGCYLALMVAALIMIVCVMKKLLLLSIPAVAALPFVLPETVIARFSSITNLADTSTSYRLNIWQGAVRLLGDFWALGIGLGEAAFQKVYPKYALNAIVAPHAHNLYLQIMLEMGIAGLLTFAAAIFCFIHSCVRAMHKAAFLSKLLIVSIMAGVIGFLFQGIFDYVWYNYRVVLLFFMTLGIGMSACSLIERGEELH